MNERREDPTIRESQKHGSFTLPLIFLAAGGMGPSTTIAYKRLAALLAEKRGQKYCLVHDDVAETQVFVQPPAICKPCNQRPPGLQDT